MRSLKPELLKAQYEQLGLVFGRHQHGNGPIHFAAEHNGFVFEIYPLSKHKRNSSAQIRLGFVVQGLKDLMQKLKSSTWEIVREPQETEWGRRAIVEDLDGRKVELKQALNN
ncbi:MAG: glyoxalase/bleomycin resistance/extradiol dioxygenase family protein [Bacteroidia bacterium]